MKARKYGLTALIIIGGRLARQIGLGWAGLSVQPAPFFAVPLR